MHQIINQTVTSVVVKADYYLLGSDGLIFLEDKMKIKVHSEGKLSTCKEANRAQICRSHGVVYQVFR